MVIIEKQIREYDIDVKFYIFIYAEKHIFEYGSFPIDGMEKTTDTERVSIKNDELNSILSHTIQKIIRELSTDYYIGDEPNHQCYNF